MDLNEKVPLFSVNNAGYDIAVNVPQGALYRVHNDGPDVMVVGISGSNPNLIVGQTADLYCKDTNGGTLSANAKSVNGQTNGWYQKLV